VKTWCFLSLFCLIATGCKKSEPEDEAKLAGLTTADFPQITADIFKPMDGGIALTPNEIMGRNTWNLWSGGNQHFWNRVAQDSYGLMDLLKTLDNRKYPRGERFKTLGLINEPGFVAATGPDDRRRPGDASPFFVNPGARSNSARAGRNRKQACASCMRPSRTNTVSRASFSRRRYATSLAA